MIPNKEKEKAIPYTHHPITASYHRALTSDWRAGMTTVKGNSGGDSNGNVKLQEWEGNSGGDSGNSAMARTLP